jgi:hypothetical protein
MRPDPQARALRKIVAETTESVAGTTFFAKKISGIWQRYDLPGDHPLVGRSAPDLELADGSRLADHLHEGRALLLDPSGEPHTLTEGHRDLTDGYRDRVKVITTAFRERPGPAGLFVRPDGFVAWAADTRPVDLDSLARALSTWLGEPATESTPATAFA